MSNQANPIIGKRSSTDQLEGVIGEIQAILDILTAPAPITIPNKATWTTTSAALEQSKPAADADSIEAEANEIESRMERVGNDINGNPRYVLHFLAFDSDYATAKDIANSIGWSVYRAKSHGGCFVGQSYSTRTEATYIAKAKARRAESAGGEA